MNFPSHLPYGRTAYPSLAVIDGNPAISYYDSTDSTLKFARNTAVDGSSSWTVISPVGSIGVDPGTPSGVTGYTTLKVLLGTPAISYFDFQAGLMIARCSTADGSGLWSRITVDSGIVASNLNTVGQFASLAIMANRNPCLSYYDGNSGDLKFATVTYPADIAVEQPIGTDIPNGGGKTMTIPVSRTTSVTFTIKNVGNPDLTGLTITKDGANASEFTVTSNPVAPVSGPSGTTTFTVQFAPTAAGTRTAAIHIASNDPDENPFDINLTGYSLSSSNDTDGDGLNDVAEFDLASLGFDWQVSQPSLVNSLYNNANTANLYTPSQVQALNMGVPLIQRNPSTGQFKLTIGIQKSTDLINYVTFPFVSGQTVINGQGQVEFTFGVPDNAAFFRLEAH